MATVSELIAAADKANQAAERLEKAKIAAASPRDTTAVIEKALATEPERLPAQPRDAKAEGRWGFHDFGQFAREVVASKKSGSISPIIQKAFNNDIVQKSALGMGELVGSDGGFLVPPTFSNTIFERLYKENDLLSRTDQYTVTGNSMVFPRNNESSRVDGSRWGGVRAYWLQEGTTGTRSAPTFGRHQLTLHKLMCLAAVTDELIQDSGQSLNQYLNRVFPAEIGFTVGKSLIAGTGAGQPLGILNAPCTISVSKETGQDAATIVSANIVKMWARLFRGMGSGENSGAVWYINQDVTPQLHLLTLGIGTAGVVTYMPPGGLSGKPYATLMGAPVVELEWCSTLGTVGDIILADMSHMVSISKGGMEAMSSIHLYFDSDQQAFRVTFRIDAQPWEASALTPFNGTNTQSSFVTLATR